MTVQTIPFDDLLLYANMGKGTNLTYLMLPPYQVAKSKPNKFWYEDCYDNDLLSVYLYFLINLSLVIMRKKKN